MKGPSMGAQAHIGVVMGLDNSVAQYHGTQYHLGTTLPEVPFLQGEATVWSSWPDDRPEEQRVGPWGATLRAGVAADVNDLIPFYGQVPHYPLYRQGHRNHFAWGIDKTKNYLLDPADNYFVSIDPRLVTPSGEPCPDNWRENDTQCVIEVGEEEDGPIEKGFKTAAAISAMTGGFTMAPHAASIASSAIALGYLKKADASVANYCGKQ